MAMPSTLHRFTTDEVERMVQVGILHEDDRLELLDGQLVEMSPIDPPHASCVNRLTRLFAALLTSNRATVSVQNHIVLNPHQAPQPDLAVVRYRADGYRGRHPGPADTLLVIEVADSSVAWDRERKLPLYAEAGVPEMWLVNLPADVVEVHRAPEGRGYAEVRTARRGATIAPQAFPDLTLRVDEILAG
jgi:Uma2 family endonuclease